MKQVSRDQLPAAGEHLRPGLTEDDIVNRAEERRRESLAERFWYFCAWMYHEFRVFGWRPRWWK